MRFWDASPIEEGIVISWMQDFTGEHFPYHTLP